MAETDYDFGYRMATVLLDGDHTVGMPSKETRENLAKIGETLSLERRGDVLRGVLKAFLEKTLDESHPHSYIGDIETRWRTKWKTRSRSLSIS